MARKLIKEVESVKRHNMIYNIPKDIAPKFLDYCLVVLKSEQRIEELDCEKSFHRKKSDKTLNEILEILSEAACPFYSFILRNNYSQFDNVGNYWEFCASTFKDGVEHFLWIEINKEDGDKLVEKYKLIKNDETSI